MRAPRLFRPLFRVVCWWRGKHRLWMTGGWRSDRPLTEWRCRDCGHRRHASAGKGPSELWAEVEP